MLRTLKRSWRRRRSWQAAQPLLRGECREVLEEIFKPPLTLTRTGGSGRDVVILVSSGRRPIAYLRIVDPLEKPSVPPAAGLPFYSPGRMAKVMREWHAYEAGAESGLTPLPLWYNEYSLLSKYIAADSLMREAAGDPQAMITLTIEAMPRIAALHELGIIHMDMSLNNILRRKNGGTLLFVDFEYAPNPDLSFEQQALYDYLRLFESCYKFIPASQLMQAYNLWRSALQITLPEAVLQADWRPLKTALKRLQPEILLEGERVLGW